MKARQTSTLILAILLAAVMQRHPASAENLTGNTTINPSTDPAEPGFLDIKGSLLTLGSGAGSGTLGGVRLLYTEVSSVPALSTIQNGPNPGLWEWGYNYSPTNGSAVQMALDPTNSLTLHGTKQIVLNPVTGQISVGSSRVLTQASNNSINFGPYTQATGSGSLAGGLGSNAQGPYSLAFGSWCYAPGNGSVALGTNNQSSGTSSTASGLGNKAIGDFSTVLGQYSEARGGSSIAIGAGSYAYGEISFAGVSSIANADYSVALGAGCISDGIGSTALGAGVTGLQAEFATAVGYGVANGECAFAAGQAKAESYASTALGAFNSTWGNLTEWVEDDPLLLVGNGTDFETGASNAITTLKNGQTTLTNKAWMNRAYTVAATADPSDADTDAQGNALVVEGHTVLKGKVVIEQPQGDISMGIYGQ